MISEEHLTVGVYARQRLLADEEIQSLVGEKIYPSIAKDNTEGTFIVYERDSYNVETSKMGIYLEEAQIGYEVVSDDYDEGVQAALAICRVLQGKHGGFNFELILAREFYEENKFRQILVFKIT